MTEAEWSACIDPCLLLSGGYAQWGHGWLGMREARLYAVASCRRAWHLLPDDRCRQAVEAAEAWADRIVPWEEVSAGRRAAHTCFVELLRRDRNWGRVADLACACSLAAARTKQDVDCASWRITLALAPDGSRPVWDEVQCELLRDIVGNPFRGDRPWLPRTPEVTTWARDCYDRRDFDSLPVLADLLEDEGASDPEVLRHCRSGAGHVRGCWVYGLLAKRGRRGMKARR